ncbi:MAG: SRPBCC domain-containing protein [Acidimicrobiales bacterium]
MTASSDLPRNRSVSSEVNGVRATLTLRRSLQHPRELVWQAITDPNQIQRWFLTAAKIDGRVGGVVELTTGTAGVHAIGRILKWDPPHVFEYEWNVMDAGGAPFAGERTVVRWELDSVDDGTSVVLTHRNLTRAAAAVIKVGLPIFMDRLAAQLSGRELPDFERGVNEARGPGAAADKTRSS